MKKTYSIRFVAIILFAMVFSFSFWNDAQAQSGTTAPNPGDPITIDGIISDWDLDTDFYAEFPRENDATIIEGNIYIRMNYGSGIMYILVMTTNPSPNLVAVPPDATYVEIDGVPQTGWTFSFVNQTGSFAEGWEASFPITVGQHNIVISSNFDHTVWERAKLSTVIDVYPWDYGDLPDSYGTTSYNSTTTFYGPKHSAGALRLGLQVDGEGDGQPSTSPIMDDLVARNDEDGVITIGNWRNQTPTIQYTVNGCTGTCYLSAWIDWGHYDDDSGSWLPDGTFGITDTLLISEPVINGTNTFTFTIPADVGFAATFNTRFRLCDTADGCSTPHSLSLTDAPFGEVEDYQWSFSPNAVTLNSFSATPTQNSTILYLLAGSVVALLILGTATLIQKRKGR